MLYKLTKQEKQALLAGVEKTKQQEFLTAFQKGVEYALTGKIPVQKQPVLFQPKTN